MSTLETIVDELKASAETLGEEPVEAAVCAIDAHSRFFVYGTGRSGLMLKAFAMRLMQLGLTAYVVGETTTPSIEKGDLLFVASASGETGSVVMMAENAAKQGADLFVVCSNPESSLAKVHRPEVLISSPTKFSTAATSIQPLGSLFEQMLLVFFDGVVLRCFERKDEGTNDAMAQRHANLE